MKTEGYNLNYGRRKNKTPKWDDDVTVTKLEDQGKKANQKAHVYSILRPLMGYLPGLWHWLSVGGPETEQDKKTQSFPLWCRNWDPETETTFTIDESGDALIQLFRRHRVNIVRREVFASSGRRFLELATKQKGADKAATLQELQDILFINNLNPNTRINPYHTSYKHSDTGEGIILSVDGCACVEVDEEVNEGKSHKAQKIFKGHYIERGVQNSGEQDYIQLHYLPTQTVLTKMEEIEKQQRGGMPLGHDKVGCDIQIKKDLTQNPNCYSVLSGQPSPLTPAEIKYA